MKVVCENVEDFLFNIESEGPDKINQKVVYVSYVKNPIGGNKLDSVKWEIGLQASTIVNTDDEGQYMIVVGIDCGFDYTDASHDYSGTREHLKQKEKIEKFCKNNGLTIRPGAIDAS